MKSLEDLKDEILNILDDVTLGRCKLLPKEIRKGTKCIIMLLLLWETRVSLENMKKAIKELLEKKKIRVVKDFVLTKANIYLNQDSPSKEILSKEPTKDQLFIYSYVTKID